jgi:transcriptional regulator with XRE-family HTH domain
MRLKDWLTDRDVTAAAFAVRIGVTPQAVHRYLLGRKPRSDVLVAILKATGGQVTPNDFFCPERMAA